MKARQLTRKDLQLSGKTMPEMVAVLKRYGVELGAPPLAGAMFVTNCCADKGVSGNQWATPDKMYVSPRIKRFVAAMGRRRYGIVSDLYGICLSGCVVKAYELHPSALTTEHLWEVGAKLRAMCDKHSIRALHYVGSPPTTLVPYLIILFASGIPFTVATKLPLDLTPA